LQNVDLVLRVLYRPKIGKLGHINLNLGRPDDYAEKVLPGLTNEVLKSTVAAYNAEQLVTQREKVSAEIRETLQKRCFEFNINLDDVSITDLNFTRDFA
jgi:regulator of protease activity HflC (stomatin/prohibitin superfamily)